MRQSVADKVSSNDNTRNVLESEPQREGEEK